MATVYVIGIDQGTVGGDYSVKVATRINDDGTQTLIAARVHRPGDPPLYWTKRFREWFNARKED